MEKSETVKRWKLSEGSHVYRVRDDYKYEVLSHVDHQELIESKDYGALAAQVRELQLTLSHSVDLDWKLCALHERERADKAEKALATAREKNEALLFRAEAAEVELRGRIYK
jgi:hypothetical protein